MNSPRVVTLVAGLMVLPAAIGLSAVGAAAAAPPPMSAASPVSIFSGNGFGSFAEVGTKAIAGRSAAVALCTTEGGVDKASDVAGVDLTGLLSTGAVNTAASSRQPQSGPATQVSANVEDVSVLSDVVSATSVRSISTTSHDADGFHVRGSVSFTDLVVDGRQIEGRVAPNTIIRLRGVGRVVLNEQKADVGASTASLTVNMLHVYVTHDVDGVAKGTQVIVAHATSALGIDLIGSVDGMAYGTTVYDGDGVSSGPSARVVLGCGGTDGSLKTNTASGVDAPAVITTSTITDTARGTVTSNDATAETTAVVKGVNVATGLVTADAIKADAHATKSADGFSYGGGGSSYTKLVVAGQPIDGRVAPNTRVEVGNITVWLHRVIRHGNSIEIRMVDVIVHGSNGKGLPSGTHIHVAVAEASAH